MHLDNTVNTYSAFVTCILPKSNKIKKTNFSQKLSELYVCNFINRCLCYMNLELYRAQKLRI